MATDKILLPTLRGYANFAIWDTQVRLYLKMEDISREKLASAMLASLGEAVAAKLMLKYPKLEDANPKRLRRWIKDIVINSERRNLEEKFYERRKSRNETVAEYAQELSILASLLKIRKKDLIRRFLDGLPNTHSKGLMKFYAFENESEDWDKVVARVDYLLKEDDKTLMREGNRNTQIRKRFNGPPSRYEPPEKKRLAEEPTRKSVVCYACNKEGHIATACPEKASKKGDGVKL